MVAALITVALILVLTVVLPVLSFRRASASRDGVARLERRLAVLEDLAQRSRPARPTAAPDAEIARPAPGAPPAPVAIAATAPAPDATRQAPSAWTQTAPTRLEARIGTRWMLYVGVATLVIGMGLFIRYAFVNQWITEPLRVGIGLVTGVLLMLTGRRFATAGHPPFGQMLVGGGIATWYLAVYAALNLYGLVNAVTGSLLLVSVTVVAAMQADRAALAAARDHSGCRRLLDTVSRRRRHERPAHALRLHYAADRSDRLSRQPARLACPEPGQLPVHGADRHGVGCPVLSPQRVSAD